MRHPLSGRTPRRRPDQPAAGVTKNADQRRRGSRRDSAASTTRSAGCSSGRWTWRRSTATSWRRTRSSTSLAPPSRASWVSICRIWRSRRYTSEALMDRSSNSSRPATRTKPHRTTPHRIAEPHTVKRLLHDRGNAVHRHSADRDTAQTRRSRPSLADTTTTLPKPLQRRPDRGSPSGRRPARPTRAEPEPAMDQQPRKHPRGWPSYRPPSLSAPCKIGPSLFRYSQ